MLGTVEQLFVENIRQSKFLVATVLLAVLWTAEWLAPMYLGHRRRISHASANIGLAVINGCVAYVGAFGILFVTEYSRNHEIGLVHRGEMSVALQWVLAILLFDCWQYWWHRINHKVRFLWRFHSVHHSDKEMDATSGVRFHTVEIAYSIVARMAVLPLIGVTIPQLVLYEAVSLPVVMFHHSNIKISERIDRCLRWLIVTPWIHWVHHSVKQPETDSNYSSFLSIWDRLFGSYRLRAKPQEIKLGLNGWKDHEWRGTWGMLSAPFRRW